MPTRAFVAIFDAAISPHESAMIEERPKPRLSLAHTSQEMGQHGWKGLQIQGA